MRINILSTGILLLFMLQGANAQPINEDAGSDLADDEAAGADSLVGADRYSSDDIGRKREGDTLDLSLIEAIQLGLQNNLAIEIQRYSPLISAQDQVGAWGSYDPTAYADVGYADSVTPNAFVLTGQATNDNRGIDGVGGIRGILPYLGTGYDLNFGTTKKWTNSVVQAFSPELVPSYEVSFTQPLLRNLIWNESWTRISTTKIAHATSQEFFRRDVMDAVRNIENAYWELIAAQEQKGVDRKSLETARALLDQVNTQFEVGVVSKVEVVEAEAGVAEREFNLIVTENNYENQQDALYDQIFGTKMVAVTDTRIQPSENPENYVLFEVSRARSVEMAFELRPELEAARNEIERQEYLLKFAKNQWLPEFSARVSYGNQGLGGEPNPDLDPRFGTPPPATSYGDSFSRMDGSRQVTVGGILSYPIGNRGAGSQVSKTQLELRRTHTQLKRQEQTVIIEVRRAVRGLKAAQEGIMASERRRLAAEEQLRAERIRLEYGESTPFDVLQRERDLVSAESEKINALRAYRVAATELARAQGTILRDRNIVIEDVAQLR